MFHREARSIGTHQNEKLQLNLRNSIMLFQFKDTLKIMWIGFTYYNLVIFNLGETQLILGLELSY